MPTTSSNGSFRVNAYVGDAKTLLAFNLPQSRTKQLAGFTIQCKPGQGQPYYLQNQLRFKTPSDHAQDATLPANSSFNAPIHKFRWLHVPGSLHQGIKPFFGNYTYTVTPRYFDASGSLLPIDAQLSAAVTVRVQPFQKGKIALGFTRGFVQSQAFVRHFGPKAHIRPKGADLTFDTTVEAGRDATGTPYSYDDQYEWLGFTAQDRIFEILDQVKKDKKLRLDVFAYDLNEPYFVDALLALAKQGRVRVILDNAALHTNAAKSKPEDEFEKRITKIDKQAILRGKFGRYAHDKVLIVCDAKSKDSSGARKVLTGSTNFSVTGLYVNSNHVLVFDDAQVAKTYGDVFDFVWAKGAKNAAFQQSAFASQAFSFSANGVPQTDVTFSPHTQPDADRILAALVARVAAEGKKKSGSVLFAVMELDQKSTSVVYKALNQLHANQDIFSFGISDNPAGISVYVPGSKRGLLVTGKPIGTRLPPPFNQVPGVGLGHQIHHKFVVCGFNSPDAVVYCGSSNLANLGEQVNGDNLLAIHDRDVATAFALEAVALVDHFNFLNRFQDEAKASTGSKPKTPPTSPKDAAAEVGWFLSTTDAWVKPYFDPKDLHCDDRKLFG